MKSNSVYSFFLGHPVYQKDYKIIVINSKFLIDTPSSSLPSSTVYVTDITFTNI